MQLHQDLTFTLTVPLEWTIRRDEDRVYFVSAHPPGVLCCTPEKVSEAQELPNLARMLAGFLTRTGHPVATDELLRITNVVGASGYCWQYFENGMFHRLWVFGNEVSWLLLTFSSSSADYDAFHAVLETIVKSLSLAGE